MQNGKQPRLSLRYNSVHLLLWLVLSVLYFPINGCVLQQRNISVSQQARAQELINQGVQMQRSKRFDDARGAFATSFEIVPSAVAIDGIGCVDYAQGDLYAAQSNFAHALELDPDYGPAFAHLALVYEAFGRKDLAAELHLSALARVPEDAQVRNNFAAFLADMDDKSGARRELLKARALDKSDLIEANLRSIEPTWQKHDRR